MPEATVEVRDAAFPGNLAGYGGGIGGYLPSPRAYNPWSPADWARFQGNRKLPIWVATMAGEDDAFATLRALYDLNIPHGKWVAADLEGRIDRTWCKRYGAVMNWAGYRVALYGSIDTVFDNPLLDGTWVADWTGAAHMAAHANVIGTQYVNGSAFDTSLFDATVVTEFWQ